MSASRTGLIFSYFMIFLLCGCGLPAQKGGKFRSTGFGNAFSLQQGENPSTPSRVSQTRTYKRRSTIPPEIFAGIASDFGPTNRMARPVIVEEEESTGIATELGSAQKDEGRILSARYAAMKPLLFAGIALLLAAIAAFYFGWPSLGLLAIAVGGGMILTAAVVPGHEILILSVGGIGLVIVALVLVYAYHKGKLDANHNGIPDFLEKKTT